MVICALSQGKTKEADEILVKYFAKHKELGTPEHLLEQFLGQMYENANILDEAEVHFRKSCELYPQRHTGMYQLAAFLIYNDIKIDEGMELVRKGLEIQPDHELLLQLKGWGLYKQGRYEESVQLLNKMWEQSLEFNYGLYQHLQEAKQALANQNK
jgi:tetratricopeptide (TPR) repeat protein